MRKGNEDEYEYIYLGLIPGLERFLWRRKWQPTPVFWPRESHGQRAWQDTVHGVTRARYDLATKPLPPIYLHMKRKVWVTEEVKR